MEALVTGGDVGGGGKFIEICTQYKQQDIRDGIWEQLTEDAEQGVCAALSVVRGDDVQGGNQQRHGQEQ